MDNDITVLDAVGWASGRASRL